MTTPDKPEALRLADLLQAGADDPMWADHCEMLKRTAALSAACLRSQHAEIERLTRELAEARAAVSYEVIPGAVWEDDGVTLVSRGTEDRRCLARGSERLYRRSTTPPAPQQQGGEP